MPPPKNKRVVKMSAITQAHLVKLLLDGVYTCPELAQETGLHYVTVLQYCRELHRAGAAHICDWGLDSFGRDALKIYKIGAGKDRPRRSLSRAEIAKRYRAKRQARELIHLMAGAI